MTLGDLLGAGGYAAAYRAALADGRAATIKVAHSPSRAAALRFQRERAALSIAGGSAAPRVLDAGESDEGRPYLALESGEGAPLGDLLADRAEPPPPAEIATLGGAIAEALAALHGQGLVHGDLSPENILVCRAEGARVTLIDFGSAHGPALAGDPPRGAGTPAYAAPEIVRGEPAARAADIYALGAILYEIASLRPPFAGDAGELAHAHLTLAPPPVSERAPAPPALDDLLAECLAKSPDARPRDLSAIEHRLALACRERAASPAARPDRDRSSPPAPAILAAVATEAPAPEVATAAGSARAALLRHTGGAYLCALLAEDADRPGEAGLALARALAALPGAVALHLARIRVRERPGRAPLAIGHAVDEPDSWLPAGPWSGIVASEAFARALPAGRLAPADAPGLYAIEERAAGSAPARVGRETELAAAEASFSDCAATARPALLCAEGAPGAGRSRFLAEAIARARARAPGLAVVDFSHDAPEASAGEALARARAGPTALRADDLEGAGAEAVDALVRAALDHPGAALWIVAALSPEARERWPHFGASARRLDRVELGPLPPAEAEKLASELLAPAEYIPASALRQVADWAGGLPGAMAEIARALVREGVIRRRARGDSYRLDAQRLAEIASVPSAPWVAARAIEGLGPELQALARRAAPLAPAAASEIAAVQRAVAERGEAVADAEAGLSALVQRGLYRARAGDVYEPATALLGEGLGALLGADEREAVHRAALDLWRRRAREAPLTARGLEALARHAGAAGSAREAAAALLTLADEAAASFRHIDADRHYTAALRFAGGGSPALRALLGRGGVRYRIDRVADAIADLREARKMAHDLGDRDALARTLLEEATALDWASDWEGSARRAEEASAIAGASADPVLEARILAARGRSAWRRGEPGAAAPALARAADAAAAAGDHDSRVVALLLLPLALIATGDLESAEARFEEVIALCAHAGDKLHLAAAYGNRTILWSARGAPPEASRADLRRARAIARALGHPGPERAPTFNLAEDLFWAGEDEAALELAERARAIAARLWPRPVPEDALLCGRIAAFGGDAARARAELAWIEREVPRAEWSAAVDALARSTRLLVDGASGAAFAALADEARARIAADEHIEILCAWALAAARAGRLEEACEAAGRARARTAEAPIWLARVETIERELG